MPENLPNAIAETFPAELRSFWSLCLLSLVLGALAFAYGLWFIMSAFLAGAFGAFQLVQAFAGWAALVIGFRWALSTGKILKGVSGILRDYEVLEGSAGGEAREESRPPGKPGNGGLASATPEAGKPPDAESPGGAGKAEPGGEPEGSPAAASTIDGLVNRMMAHYRENWKTYWKMAPISRLAGWIFMCLGVLAFIEGYPAWLAGEIPNFPFFAGGIAIALGVAAILTSSRFGSFARTWEHRLIDAGQADEILQGERV
jgi:hypothetical protein